MTAATPSNLAQPKGREKSPLAMYQNGSWPGPPLGKGGLGGDLRFIF